MSKIFVWGEHFNGSLIQASREALGLANQLGGTVTALVFGKGIDGVVQEAFHYGANSVIKSDDTSLENFTAEAYIALLSKVVSDEKPDVVLAPATTRGREIMGGTAADLDAPLLNDVSELKLEGGKLTATRGNYSGKVITTETVVGAGSQFATLRNRAFKPLAANAGNSGDVKSVAPVLSADKIGTQLVSMEASTGKISLTDAAIIVSGGRAVGGSDGFAPVHELADVLGGAVGASRAAVDAGWIPYEHQVGQTGKVVSPDLYVAAGISGSIQHQAGMRTSKVIVAVNKDSEAPIYQVARYGVVEDLFKFLPALAQAFRQRLGK